MLNIPLLTLHHRKHLGTFHTFPLVLALAVLSLLAWARTIQVFVRTLRVLVVSLDLLLAVFGLFPCLHGLGFPRSMFGWWECLSPCGLLNPCAHLCGW